MSIFKLVLAVILVISCIAVPLLALDSSNSYGICAHISRKYADFPMAETECELIANAGLYWARTDFDWSTLEKSEGNWDFSLFDQTIAIAESKGVTILPILGYSVNWAHPAYKHMDKWLEYVRRTVIRYKDRLTYWEIWNESNGEGFWGDEPRAEDYAILLRETYKEIKKIDPDLQVIFGGLAGVPMDYIDTVYQTIGNEYFDMLAVHPYRYPNSPEQQQLYENLIELRELMTKYGDGDKRIWLTELGWPTHKNKAFVLSEIIQAGLKSLELDKKDIRLAIVNQNGYPAQNTINGKLLQRTFTTNGKLTVEELDLKRSCEISNKDFNIILLPPEEAIYPPLFENIEKFVRNGGTAIFTYGVPLYYNTIKDPITGSWKHQSTGEQYRNKMHIGWEAWWTKDGIPKESDKLISHLDCSNAITLKDYPKATRFLNDAKLKGHDKFIPLVQVSDNGYTGTAAAAINFDSNLKGSVIISSLMIDNRGITPQQQAVYLPRVFNLCFAAGIEKVFWYNLRAAENNPYYNEDNFGIVHADLSAKPAYTATCALTKVRPQGSSTITQHFHDGDIYFPSWKRPDKTFGYALWSSGNEETIHISNAKFISESFDYMGKPIELDCQDNKISLNLSDKTIYLIANEELTIAK